MKYNEVIHVNNDFNPVYDLENEEDNAWKLFIPNEKFRDILSSTIDSLDINKQKHPVWLQGTYGTGKSHATSVIKHLLSDEDIGLFDIENPQLEAKLNNFRKENKILPVIIKGTGTISTPQKFRITIQNAVKNTLKDKNMIVTVPSDFEHILKLLNNGTITLTDENLEGTELEFYGIDEIKNRLKNQDQEILLGVEDILEENGVAPIQNNIVEWLAEISDELKKEHQIDYVMIFWDEFTGALNQINVEDILLEIQNIAEAKNKGMSLFIVSHRTRSNQTDINEERLEKIMDRFQKINYSMEPVATYELMAKSITKDKGWEGIKNRYLHKIKPLIKRISGNEGPRVEEALENLYPIHPYTSYLATFIAREIGSTERSIFRFLHDDTDNGFKRFIDTYEINERYFLTAEYLWDFFYNDFDEKDDDKISSAIQKYKLHYEKLNQMEIEYLTIFKVVLLLNILYKIAEVSKDSLAIPSRENINNIFVGSIYEDKVNKVLDYIDEHGIINESPDHYFELTTNTLDSTQVAKEFEKLKNSVKLTDILNSTQLSKITDNIDKKVIREAEIKVKEGTIQKNRLLDELNKGLFKKPGYLHILLFLCKNEKELLELENTISSISNMDELKDTIIVISHTAFKEKNLKKFLDFKAKERVAEKYNYKEDVKVYSEGANKLSDEWLKNIRTGPIHWYLGKDGNKSTFGQFTSTLNEKISKNIFYNGLENINETRKNRNIWPHTHAKKQAEHYINSRSYDELSSKLEKRYLLILKDNNGDLIVNSNLELKENVSNNHPIKLLQEFVDNTFEKAQIEGEFNLGKKLKPLTEAPYGLYPNAVNIAALSFVMRKYVNKLYDEKGLLINAAQMKEKILNMFEYWDRNRKVEKLNVRFGTEEEKKLIKLLIDIFDLDFEETQQSIQKTRWEIKNWIKKNKLPLWLFKYSDRITNPLKNSIDTLTELLMPEDGNIPSKIIENTYYSLNSKKVDFEYLLNTDKEKMLERYLCGIDEIITKDNIPEICEYVTKIMPEEIHAWDEENVRRHVKWYANDKLGEKPKLIPKIKLNVENTEINQMFTAEVETNDDVTGIIEFYIDNEKVGEHNLINGKAEYKTNSLLNGNHNIYAFYQGDDCYNDLKTETKLFTIDLPGTININGGKFKDNEKAFVEIKTNKQTSVNVYKNNEKIGTYTVPIDGMEINLGKLNAGIYNIKVEYEDDFTINDETKVTITKTIVEPTSNIISRLEHENAENVKNITIKILKENKEFRMAFERLLKG